MLWDLRFSQSVNIKNNIFRGRNTLYLVNFSVNETRNITCTLYANVGRTWQCALLNVITDYGKYTYKNPNGRKPILKKSIQAPR